MKRTSIASFRPQTWQLSLHVALALLCLRAAPAFSTIDTLVVLHTNDFHGYISPDGDRAAGLARIATYFNSERARSSKVLALDAGDCVSGTPVSILFQGRPIFEVMTAVGYDAVVLGNHEFDHGWREILAYRDIADFPLLSANARGPAGELIADAPFATLSFVVEPPRRESFIGTAKSVWLEEVLIRDVVIDYIKEGGPIDALLTPTTTEE